MPCEKSFLVLVLERGHIDFVAKLALLVAANPPDPSGLISTDWITGSRVGGRVGLLSCCY